MLKNLPLPVRCCCSNALLSWWVKFAVKVTAWELFVGTWTISSAKFSYVKNAFGIEIFVSLMKSSRSVSSLIVYRLNVNQHILLWCHYLAEVLFPN